VNGRACRELVLLRLAVSRGRLARALARRGGPLGPLLELLLTVGSVLLLLLSALAFTVVGTVLIATLARRGEAALAIGASSGASLAGLLLAAIVAVLADAHAARLDDRPLSALPIRPGDRIAADLFGLMVLEPTAAVIWPTAAVLVLAAAQSGGTAAMLAVPAAAGQACLAASVALVARRLSRSAEGSRPGPWLVAGATALLIATTTFPPSPEAAWMPWHWNGRAFLEAWNGRAAALAWGTLPHLFAFGLLALARTPPVALRRGLQGLRHRLLPPARRGPRRRYWTGLRHCWGPPRARILLMHAIGATAALLALGWALDARSSSAFPVMTLASVVAAWVAAAGAAPLLANTLGLGGPAAASQILAARRPLRRLAADHVWLSAPALAATALAAAAAAARDGAPSKALPALAVGAAITLSLSGTGAFTSTRWPWPACLGGHGDPLWSPTGPRSLMALVQGTVLAPMAGAAWQGFESVSWAAFATLALGAGVGVVGWAVAVLAMRRLPVRILEGLLP
jgi:hypothetical protein